MKQRSAITEGTIYNFCNIRSNDEQSLKENFPIQETDAGIAILWQE